MKLEEIFSFDNLYDAYNNCKNSKQHKGEVIRFEMELGTNLVKLNKELIGKKYKFGKYKKFYIYEPKERLIEALPFKDRIVIRCFCDNSLKNKIENKLIYDNAACRKNKGTSFAIERLNKFLHQEFFRENNNYVYFLKCDIKKYFPSINHQVLIDILTKMEFTEDEMWFINKIIREQPNNANIGLPLGNQSSQWFALLYLNEVDRLIKEKLKIKHYIRYMDDMILIHRDREYLKYCKFEIEKLCSQNLKLELNSKTQIGKVEDGIDFLGFRHILTSSGKVIYKLRSSSRIRLKRHLKNLLKLENNGIVDATYVYLRKNAYYNHIKNTKENINLKNKVKP